MSFAAFVELYTALDQTTRTSDKLRCLELYFRAATPADAAWAIACLSGRRPKTSLPMKRLVAWAAEFSEIPEWLFDECYSTVGDLGETIALLLPTTESSFSGLSLSAAINDWLLPLRSQTEPEQRAALKAIWSQLSPAARFVWNKLLTGGFRVGVSRQLVTRALANALERPSDLIAQRLMGDWQPTAEFVVSLSQPDDPAAQRQRPYPFCLAEALADSPMTLGNVNEWQLEWKYDGIRAQLICRDAGISLWSRGEELITEQFPEIVAAAGTLPNNCVLDGEIVVQRDGVPQPFAALQRRLGRKQLTSRMQAQWPCVLLAFDLLELSNADLRDRPLSERRRYLEQLLAEHGSTRPAAILISPVHAATCWDDVATLRENSREQRTEGLMLKRLTSDYIGGRHRGSWWKWKVAPFTIDAVLVYAQLGHGRRASLYTDYTFAVWDNGQLVPFAKAYSGLNDEEIVEVDHFVREHTGERFGPVRSVTPELVFELAFENIQLSPRHRSGVAVRFPRMLRWRKDKQPHEADQLTAIKQLLARLPQPAPAATEPVADSGPSTATRSRKAAERKPQSRSRAPARGQLTLFDLHNDSDHAQPSPPADDAGDRPA